MPRAHPDALTGTLAVGLVGGRGPLDRDFDRLVARLGRVGVARVADSQAAARIVGGSRSARVVLYLPLSVLVETLSAVLDSPHVLPELIAVVPVARRSLRRLPPAMGLLDWCAAPTRFGTRALRAAWPGCQRSGLACMAAARAMGSQGPSAWDQVLVTPPSTP